MDGTCRNCGGLIMEKGKCYGYAGKVCHCEPVPRYVTHPMFLPQAGEPVLPYEIDVGGVRFGKGVKLQTFVDAAARWKQQATDALLSKPQVTEEEIVEIAASMPDETDCYTFASVLLQQFEIRRK